jgi:hypothetical protein
MSGNKIKDPNAFPYWQLTVLGKLLLLSGGEHGEHGYITAPQSNLRPLP